jgi:hypothetical protein
MLPLQISPNRTKTVALLAHNAFEAVYVGLEVKGYLD